jgi:hypothetical protein
MGGVRGRGTTGLTGQRGTQTGARGWREAGWREAGWREARRLRTLTLVLIAILLVGALPAVLLIREATRDPVLVELESLDLPSWAATSPHDESFGNRWCLRQCRSRERTWSSRRGVEETGAAYVRALKNAGWRPWTAPGCPPEGADGFGACWQRDEYLLNLFVRTPTCEGTPGDASVPGSSAPPGDPAAAAPPPTRGGSCPAAQATVKVFNRVSLQGGGPA